MSRFMNRWVLAVCIGGVIALTMTESVFAQRGGRGFRWMFGISKAELASLPEVQDELKLSDEQKTRITEIHDGLRDRRREMFGTGFGRFDEIWQRSDQLNRDASQTVDEVLDDSQRTRLQQIAIQQNGPRSLHDPQVVAALGLSDEQSKKLAQVRDENTQEFENAIRQFGREWRQQAGDLAAKSDERLLAVLADEQRDQFEALKGEPLEIQRWRRGGRDRQ